MEMNRLAKNMTVALTCISLLAGCAASVSASSSLTGQSTDAQKMEVAASNEEMQEELEENIDPLEEDELIEEQVQQPTSISFAEEVQQAPTEDYAPAQQQGNLETFYYMTKDYDGDGSEEEKYAIVYTPYGYNTGTKYDIMYLMHGVSGYAEIFLGYPGEPTAMKNCIDHLIEDGTVKPMIIVCMTYYDHNIEEINDNEDADITKAFYEEFQNDLMPDIERTYSTYAASTSLSDLQASRDHRIFAGFSMGGVTTWYAFMQSMAYCRYYIPISGMLYWGPDGYTEDSDAEEWSGEMLADALQAEGYGHNDFYLYTATGGYDEALPYLEAQIRSMMKERDVFTFGAPFSQGVNCTYAYDPNAEHSWLAVFQYLYNALPIISVKINERNG